MFENIIDNERYNVLTKILENNPVPDSYLAGGTALALQIGHRYSYDFDFFSPVKFDTDEIAGYLSTLGNLKILYVKNSTFHGILDNINITWLYYPNPLLDNLIIYDQYPLLKLASKVDIGVMKLTAISSRGAKRDFIDLYFICKQDITLEYLFSRLKDKFPYSDINTYHILQSLFYFTDADNEPMPKMLVNIEWEDVKNFFLHHQKSLTDYIINQL
jgi:hypothetical protein